ncbi:TIGR03013 family XrtA/PEP-CTERM system glycosyltransferase [Rhodocyclaceae bacterium SMB388]
MSKVFSHYFPSHILQQAAFDATLLFVAVLLAMAFQMQGTELDWRIIAPSALFFAVVMILLNSVMGLYRSPGRGLSGRDAAMRTVVSVVVSVPIAYGAFQVLPWSSVASDAAVELSVLLLLGLILVMRGVVNRRAASSMFMPRVLIIGTGTDAAAVAHSLTHPVRRGVEVVGFYGGNGDDPVAVNRDRVLHTNRSLIDTVRDLRVSEVIVALRERRGGVLPIRELLDCKMTGVRVLDLSSFFERTQGQIRIDSLRASWLIYGDGFRQGWGRTLVKRCFDLVASVALLVLALPVMLVTALLIMLEDRGPVFYRQERVGLNGRVFRVIKFRSMGQDAEKDGRPRWAVVNDDRTTRVGRVIRKLRIDELPQLFNVIAGDMSLVGPRPERPYFVDQLSQEIPFYSCRHCVKPGVTGWAQVRYQYGSSVDDAVQKLQYDLYYVKNHTLILDTLVLFETVRVVLTGEGAN